MFDTFTKKCTRNYTAAYTICRDGVNNVIKDAGAYIRRPSNQPFAFKRNQGESLPNFTTFTIGLSSFKTVQRFQFSVEFGLPWQPKENTLRIILFKQLT